MAEGNEVQIPRVKLGNQGLEVSKLGFGCMGLTGAYNSPLSDEDGISIIKYAFSKGITFFDTSDVYGPHSNEILLGKALKQLPREKIQVATKFGIQRGAFPHMTVNGSPDYVRSSCEASLKRLDVEYIDLYYQHRVDTNVPIEETIGELKKLVEEGKVKYIGLSEASPDTIRRAHAVHPITAVQMEWSLWTRDIEEEIIPLCRELGIGIVPYSPLGRGFFAGKGIVESLAANSSLAMHPRFQGDNLEKNKTVYTRIESLARRHQCTPAQLALAWVLEQGDIHTTSLHTTHTLFFSHKHHLTFKMGFFGFDESRDARDQVYNNDNHHESSLSHELLGAGASFAAMHEWENHQRAQGQTVSHGFAKEAIAALAGAEVDKLVETKGLDFIDREKAKHHARQNAEQLYDQQYGNQPNFDPNGPRPNY